MLRFCLLLVVSSFGSPASATVGIFDSQSSVGNVMHVGSADYNASSKTYTVFGSGENMWFANDQFHFVWKKVSARDLTLAATISILGAEGDGHRKAVLMIRQDLDPDSAYVDVARHGDGLTSIQFRERKGETTREIESNVSGPARLRLEKRGDRFYLWIGSSKDDLQFAGGSARVELHLPFYAGIGACAHQKDSMVKVVFTDLDLSPSVVHTSARYSTVETVLQSTDARVGYVSSEHLTSPGWSVDGRALTFDADGKNQQVAFTPLKTAAPVEPPMVPVRAGEEPYFVSDRSGTSQIWRNLGDSSAPERITADEFNNISPYLSPDGGFLLFLSYASDLKLLPTEGDVALREISLNDKSVKKLADFTGGQQSLGPRPWSPDGRRIVFISYQSLN